MDILGEIKNGKGNILLTVFKSNATKRNNSFRIHHHIDLEIGYIVSGKGIYKAKKDHEISSGDIFIYKPNTPHCITDIYTDFMSILNIQIHPQYFRSLSFISDNSNLFGIRFLSNDFSSNKITEVISKKSKTLIISYIKNIINEFSENKSNCALKVEMLVNEILIELSRYQIDKKEKYSSLTSYSYIFKTVEYIDEHYTEELNLSTLADISHLTKTYYSCLFKKMIGLSVWEYISIRRIDRALYELRNTEKNILDIALSCGFNNTANFNKIFLKYTGSTPHILRK